MPELNPATGIRFREIMSGHVALSAPDPEAGELLAVERGETFAFDLEIVIESLRAFLEAPQHEARIFGGKVSWHGQASDASVFNDGRLVLYRRDPSVPRKGYFDFHFSFPDQQGRRVEAEGHKILLDDAFLDAGRDLSTVFLTLRREGAIAGAGITRVHFPELITQLQSIQVTGAQDARERDAARQAFFGFMNHELRRVYSYFPRLF